MAKRLSSQLVVGLVILLLGVVLLLDNVGVYDASAVFRFFPSVLIAVGLYGLIRRGFRDAFGSLLLVGFGAAWQAVALEYLTWGEVWDFWPLVLVLIGLSMILDRGSRVVAGPASVSEVTGTQFSAVAVFSEVTRRLSGTQVIEGDAVAALGDTTVDFREVETTDPITVEAVSILGDVTIRVPEGWNVDVEATNVLGDVRDRRRSREEGDLRLVVEGIAILGDITIRD